MTEPTSTPAAEGDSPEEAPPPRKRRWPRVLVHLLIYYGVYCTFLFFYQGKLLFPADMAGEPLPLRHSTTTVELEREVDDDKVVAWFIPAPGSSEARPAPLAVFFHGNAELIDHQYSAVEDYQRLGCSVLLPEYRGYGRSSGSPSERKIVDDALFFVDEVLKRPEIDASRLILHGRSLGGGPAAQVAARRKPSALILESTFASAAAMADKYFAPRFLVRNPFRTDRVLQKLDTPVLIFHGTTDNIIPVAHGRKLRDLTKNCTYFEYACRHNDFPGTGNERAYVDEIRNFLLKHKIIQGGRP